MSSFASPKVWEEPTEVTHEGGNAGPVSGNPPGAVIGQEKQHLEESN